MVSKNSCGAILKAERGEPVGEPRRLAMHALGDGLQALRAMEHGIHRGDDGGQHLRRADVGGRALAADMLFARLQREAIGAVAARIDRDADESAGQRALIGVLDRNIAGVRTAIAHGHSEPLHGADGDIGAHFARRLQKRECQRIGRDDGDRLRVMQLRDRRPRNRGSRRRRRDIETARRRPRLAPSP